MKRLRTDDPDVCFMEADPVALWTMGITEWRIDTRNRQFLMTPVMPDKTEGPSLDATKMYERYLREQQ